MIRSAVSGLSRTGPDCGSACAGGLGLLGLIHVGGSGTVVAGLADVKAQIEADMKARGQHPLF